MGNIVSHNQRQPPELEHQWAVNSFPRSPLPRLSPLKVLPEKAIHQKLRPTNNGDILHSGGTLSGRHHHYKFQEERSFDSDSPLEYHERSRSPAFKSYLSNERDPLHKHGYRKNAEHDHNKNHYNRHQHQAYKKQLKKSGSEPDLQAALLREYQEEENLRNKTRKKYKAPSPPTKEEEREEPDGSNSPIRKPRLFKTRAEMKKKPASPTTIQKIEGNTNTEILKYKFGEREPYHASESVKMREYNKVDSKLNNRLSLPEMKRSQSMPEFQQELKEVTERLRNSKLLERIQLNVSNQKLKTLDPVIVKKEIAKEETKESSQTAKMYFFGMDEPIEKSAVTDRYASSYHMNGYHQSVPNSSGSDLSSEYEMDDLTNNGIALQLRPILPKKQLEIPRFSPAAAWRLLSSVESNTADSTVASEDGPVLIEDRIEKLSRPPPPPTAQFGHRSNHDKSGDSGISGDAGPVPFDEGVDNNLTTNAGKLRGIAWTPQQDLGDDSSVDETQNLGSRAKPFTSGPHVFSLSLPREQHLESYFEDKTPLQQCTGLQRFKKSVTGVLGNLSNKRDTEQPHCQNSNNWFLSKSAPNSLNNGFNSIEPSNPHKVEAQENVQSLVPTNAKQNSKRLMYLPELENACQNRVRIRSKSVERSSGQLHLPIFSKSCENISMEVKSSSEPEDLQDPPKLEYDNWKGRRPKKFTFQSTVRQIERRRLAEKLSREAERKEQQRLRELEAMQRVEEEFQRKRAREKATIRQQLRLYSMDDSGWSSLPPNLEVSERTNTSRPEPDGAVSSTDSSPSFITKANRKKSIKKNYAVGQSSTDSSEENIAKPPVTQILSEYRQPQREYKEFRSSTRHYSDHLEVPRQTTVHPQITCNMPKTRGSPRGIGSSNYRKNFAHGVKSNISVGSSYSDDSHVNKTKMYFSPITRF